MLIETGMIRYSLPVLEQGTHYGDTIKSSRKIVFYYFGNKNCQVKLTV